MRYIVNAKTFYLLALIFIGSIIINACRDCEDMNEPVANIFFINYSYDSIKGLQNSDLLHSLPKNINYPLAINSDSTTFVLYDSLSIDTLCFRYKRMFHFESKECGFTITLDSFQNLEATTFDSVAFIVHDESYEFPFKSSRNEYYIEVYN